MLPAESLTEAVSFLPLYDLDSVLLANRELSDVASECVKGIRVWEFDWVGVALVGGTMAFQANGEAFRPFSGKRNAADVLEIALYNSSIKRLRIASMGSFDVRQLPQKSALEIGELNIEVVGVSSAEFLVDIIDRFRKVQQVIIIPNFT